MKAAKKPLILAIIVLVLLATVAVLSSPVSIALSFTRGMMRVKGMTHHIESVGDFDVSFFESN